MTEAKKFTGGCHCGAVRYEVETNLKTVISCNCSICTKHGLLLAFAPPQNFRVNSGEEKLQGYQFNRKIINHMFCQDCGVESFARGKAPDGSDMVAINVRCLDGVDISTITPAPFNGRDM